jgi:hypothetical protein
LRTIGAQKGATTMRYFENIHTLDDLKHAYHAWCKKLHPDVGGNDEEMKALNAEYQTMLRRVMHGDFSTEAEASELLYRDKIAAIAHLDGLELEIIGKWLWVGGNTYARREALKHEGFCFAPVKKLWFYRALEYRTRTRGEAQDINDIRTKYGSEKVRQQSARVLH